MFGRKAKLEKVRADAKADYLKCAVLDNTDRMHRVFTARIAQRARLNLDKIFVQGAKAEEKRQAEMAEALKAGKEMPARAEHDGYNQLQGVSGTVVSWVPEEYANQMFQLGADYQILEINAYRALQVAEAIADKVIDDLQTTQPIQLLNLLRDGPEENASS